MIIKDRIKLKPRTQSKILVLGLMLAVLVMLSSPTALVQAQTPSTTDAKYNLLAPLPCPPNTPQCVVGADGRLLFKDFDPSQSKNLGAYLNLMIKIIIGLSAVLAVIMIIIGGMEYMTSELVSSKEEGKKRMTNAVFGLLIALGAFALLNTINPDLLGTDIEIDPATVAVNLDNTPQTPINNRYVNGNLSYTIGENWAPRAGSLANLGYSRATVYNTQCATVGQPNCTSTAGLNPSTLNTIRQNCSACVLSIQGGTEFWAHGGSTGSTSHQINSPTVDLGVTPELTRYITGGQTPILNRRYSRDGISYRYEGNHWHAGP